MPYLSRPPPGAGRETRLTKTAVYVGQIADDIGVSFTKGPDPGASRYHVSFAYSHGFIYAMGGLFQRIMNGAPTQKIVDTIERAARDGRVVSPWEMVAPLPRPLTHHASIADNNAIYVIGGGITVAALPEIVRAGARDYFHVFFACQILHFILW